MCNRTIMPLVRGFVILILVFGAVAGQPRPLLTKAARMVKVEETRYSMGCLYSITAWGEEGPGLKLAIAAALDEVDRLDRLLSHYRADSPLTHLNRAGWPGPVVPDPELFSFLARCLEYSRDSDGAFDLTVGPLMRAWGFFRGEGKYPTDAQLQDALAPVGYRHVRLDHAAGSVFFDRPGVELDPGGVAKGYAVDRAAKILRRAGVRAALISAGGSSIFAIGHPPHAAAWSIPIQDPLDSERSALTVSLRDQALSVSGSAEKYFEYEGRRYSHIMDPRTGRPVDDVLSVALITESGIDGDALDNALFVLGPAGSRTLIRKYRVREALFFVPNQPVGQKPGHKAGQKPDHLPHPPWKLIRLR